MCGYVAISTSRRVLFVFASVELNGVVIVNDVLFCVLCVLDFKLCGCSID